MSKLRELQRRNCKLEMTPMIDVTFLLLVFFMCTLQFKSLEGKLAAMLPKDVGVSITPAEMPDAIDVRIEVTTPGDKRALDGGPWSGTGPFRFDATRRLRYAVGARHFPSMTAARARLAHLHRADPARRVKIDARPGVVYGEAVHVLDTLIGVGFDDITFVASFD